MLIVPYPTYRFVSDRFSAGLSCLSYSCNQAFFIPRFMDSTPPRGLIGGFAVLSYCTRPTDDLLGVPSLPLVDQCARRVQQASQHFDELLPEDVQQGHVAQDGAAAVEVGERQAQAVQEGQGRQVIERQPGVVILEDAGQPAVKVEEEGEGADEVEEDRADEQKDHAVVVVDLLGLGLLDFRYFSKL